MIAVLSKKAGKDYNHIPQAEQKKIDKKLIAIQNNPYEGKKLLGEFSGIYSFRAWPYRILYRIRRDEEKIDIISIEHRQGVYN